MKTKNQAVWWALLILALCAIALFVFVPLGLVSHYVTKIAPADSWWIGIFFSLGLSLSIIVLSALSYYKLQMRWKIGVALLALAEGAVSFATFWDKVKLDDGGIASVIGLLGIVFIQETTIFVVGLAVFVIINEIRAFGVNAPKVPKSVNKNDTANGTQNGSSGTGKKGFLSVSGCANMPVEKIMADFGVSERTAWRWKKEARTE